MKKLSLLLCILLLLATLSSCTKDSTQDAAQTDETQTVETVTEDDVPQFIKDSTVTPTGAFLLEDKVYITEINAYSGDYLEDGSDENVKKVLELTLANIGDTDVQSGTFTLVIGGESYEFSFSTLFRNSTMTVLEKNRAAKPKDCTIDDCTDKTFAYFSETPSVHLERFEISFTDGIVNVKNKGEKTADNVYVYYKNTSEDGVFEGGITYRVNCGSISAGQISQAQSSHLKRSGTTVCFVTFTEE